MSGRQTYKINLADSQMENLAICQMENLADSQMENLRLTDRKSGRQTRRNQTDIKTDKQLKQTDGETDRLVEDDEKV